MKNAFFLNLFILLLEFKIAGAGSRQVEKQEKKVELKFKKDTRTRGGAKTWRVLQSFPQGVLLVLFLSILISSIFFFFCSHSFFPHLLSLFLFSELFIWSLQMWQRWPLRRGRRASAYPTLAESDVPPSLPHRAETATTHAAQNLLISLSLHLRHRDMRDKMQGSGWECVCAGCCCTESVVIWKSRVVYFRDTLNYHSRVGD